MLSSSFDKITAINSKTYSAAFKFTKTIRRSWKVGTEIWGDGNVTETKKRKNIRT